MLKLLLFLAVGFIIYKIFWQKTPMSATPSGYDENDLIECSKCHTFVPKDECEFTTYGCLCRDCQ